MSVPTDAQLKKYSDAFGELLSEYQQAIDLSELDGKTLRWDMGKSLFIKDTRSNVIPSVVFHPYFYTLRSESIPSPPSEAEGTTLTYFALTPRHSKSAVVRFERPGLGFVTFNVSTNPDNIPAGIKHVPLLKKNDLAVSLVKKQLVKFEIEISSVSELLGVGLETQLVSLEDNRAVVLGRLVADSATLEVVGGKERLSFKFEAADPKLASPSRVPLELHEDFVIHNYTPMPVEKPQKKGCF